MPRGRDHQTPSRAREDSELRILKALKHNLEGLTFTELKKITKLHQDTLTIRLRSLMKQGHVAKPRPRQYFIGARGLKEAYALDLLRIMLAEKDTGFGVYGGPGSASVDPLEDLMKRNTTTYAFPDRGVYSMFYLNKVVAESYAYAVLYLLADIMGIRLNEDITERNLKMLVSEFKSRKESSTQVFAFIIDLEDVVENLTPDIAREILRRGLGRSPGRENDR